MDVNGLSAFDVEDDDDGAIDLNNISSSTTNNFMQHVEQPQQSTPPLKTQQQPRQLKFVTNYGAPHPKRRRIAAACLTCRKRKTACSGERPTCETCLQNGLECAGYAPDAPAPGHKRTTSDASAVGPPPADTRSANHRQRKARPDHGHAEMGRNLRRTSTSSSGMTRPDSRIRATPVPSVGENSTIMQGSDIGSETAKKDYLFAGRRNSMPYFRWLGPTAVVPGFKQMVVKIKRHDSSRTQSSSEGLASSGLMRSPSLHGLNINGADPQHALQHTTMSNGVDGDASPDHSLPFYDSSPMPPSELVTHLANTFFTHLGCNYPFLQKARFMRDLAQKQVDAMLVDAVCALAARFSTHVLLTQQINADESKTVPAEYGHVFAQRAQTALVEAFPCPTVSAVQAALLLAYNEFGENRDSGLWMYLGISIRMAQDLGLHKIEGLTYRGMTGPTPKMVKKESMGGSPVPPTKYAGDDSEGMERLSKQKSAGGISGEALEMDTEGNEEAREEQKATEQERVDTFWGVFFLDRVVSCGTGRISTLRDHDIEISFPLLDESQSQSAWPAPYPALIRIVHLYGGIADLLNSIKEPSDITSDTPRRLASMERQVTTFYQGLSPRLHFDAVNFQHYMKAGEGTNFVLLHFWFHTLIVLLHQPTLLKTFEGRMLQLFPNSQQLSMSSAKTIADILSYSQLMDAKASLGNPFTTQPIYIAACAFLRETVELTASSRIPSREGTPGHKVESGDNDEDGWISLDGSPMTRKRVPMADLSLHSYRQPATPGRDDSISSVTAERHESSGKSMESEFSHHSPLTSNRTASALAKHTLLATAARQHYQLCYSALEAINTYWAGTKYILTVLDQKLEGVSDPVLYTAEEGESALGRPRPESSFANPAWRRSLAWSPYVYGPNGQNPEFWREKASQIAGSSPSDPSKAIGWTLTGTNNSPNTNLAWHYPTSTHASPQHQDVLMQHSRPTSSTGPELNQGISTETGPVSNAQRAQAYSKRIAASTVQQRSAISAFGTGAIAISNAGSATYLSNADAQYQNGELHATSSHSISVRTGGAHPDPHGQPQSHQQQSYTSAPSGTDGDGVDGMNNSWSYESIFNSDSGPAQSFGDMMIESQDIDMNLLGLDMLPWFDPASHDYATFFNNAVESTQASPVDLHAHGTPH